MEHKIIVVGIGPGSSDYLPPIAARAIQSAKVLVGSRRALKMLASTTVRQRLIDKDLDGIMDFIADQLCCEDVVVMVSGDPGFYSLLTKIRSAYAADRIRVIPGISSLQLAFARFSLCWQDAELVSLHGRSAEGLDLTYKPHRKIGFLTDGHNRPQVIAKKLMEKGWPVGTTVYLAENLSYEDERLRQCSLQETAKVDDFICGVMVVTA